MAVILIVDDQPETCRPLAMLLRRLGHQADCVSSGEAALQWFSQALPDLVILDVMMPGMDGLEVLRHVRSDPRTAGVAVAMYSAVSDPSFKRHAIAKGANDYWVKASLDFSELQHRVENLTSAA